ncbi:MAG: hypothetical protein HC883_04330 [Bdellovibrionaceae bacterium]|nr:hypothetical protein [Pseudobdellovibrionaceae bacterium]
MEYLKFLIGHQRFADAARLAVPLAVLNPSLLSLRDQIEKIATKAPHPILHSFLLSVPSRIGRPYITTELAVADAFVLKDKLGSLRKAVGANELPVHIIDKQLREIIGDLGDDRPLDTNLKEFYYLQAIVEERKENYFESLLLFRSLVEMDPCNLAFRRSMDTEMNYVCNNFKELAEKAL